MIITSLLAVNLPANGAYSAIRVDEDDGPKVTSERDLRNREAAAELIRAGWARDRILRDFNLGDPVWNILLDLYVAEKRGKRISTSSLAIAAAVPRSTAQRCIAALVHEAKLVRYPDKDDARRTWIALSAASRLILDSYFDGVRAEFNRKTSSASSGEVRSQRTSGIVPVMGQSFLDEIQIVHKVASAGRG